MNIAKLCSFATRGKYKNIEMSFAKQSEWSIFIFHPINAVGECFKPF